MNALTNAQNLSPATIEQVLGTGNLSALNPGQRVELMVSVCRSRGLNPLTRPFRFLSLQGQIVMYATRDCCDQLRKIDGVNVEIVRKGIEDDLYVVEVKATDSKGRHDVDLGAVVIGKLQGEAKANAIMKAITKAKRRATLSICGLGLMEESEALTLPGARPLDDDVIDHEAPPSPAHAQPDYPFATKSGGRIYHTGSEWMEAWRRLIDACKATDAIDKLRVAADMNDGPIEAVAAFDPQAAAEVREMLAEATSIEAEVTKAEAEMELPQ
jgi:hypothetical protein